MELLEQIKALVETVEDDVTKFYQQGNKAAAVRARKSLMELKKLAQDLRVDIQDTKKEM